MISGIFFNSATLGSLGAKVRLHGVAGGQRVAAGQPRHTRAKFIASFFSVTVKELPKGSNVVPFRL